MKLTAPAVMSIVFHILFSSVTPQMCHIVLNQPVSHVSYRLYTDEQCKRPALDEKGEERIVVFEDTEEVELYMEEQLYLQQDSIPVGYYLNPDTFMVEEETVLELIPIEIECRSDDERYHDMQIFDEADQLVADWNTKQSFVPLLEGEKAVFEAGGTYRLCMLGIDESIFTIPLFSEDQITIVVHADTAAMISIQTSDEQGNPLHADYGLYLDEECTKPVLDEEEMPVFFQEEMIVEPDIYWVRQEDVDRNYYLKEEVMECDLRKENQVNLSVVNTPVQAVFSLEDDQGNREEMLLLESDGEQKMVMPETLQTLQRNQTYTLSKADVKNGDYVSDPITFTTGQYPQETIRHTIHIHSFLYAIELRRKEDEQMIPEGIMIICDQDGNVVDRFTTDSGSYVSDQLEAGRSYVIKAEQMPQGYTVPDNMMINVAKTSQSSLYQKCTLYSSSYRRIRFDSRDALTNEPVQQVSFHVYTDSECTKTALDIHQKEIDDVACDLLTGTYYLKYETEDASYYEADEIRKIIISVEDDYLKEISIALQPVSCQISLKDEVGTQITQAEVEILDEAGNVICDMSLDDGDDLSQWMQKDTIRYIRIRSAAGLYTYSREAKKIVIPKYAPEELPTADFIFHRYYSLRILDQDDLEQAAVGGTYGLFVDEACTTIAKDIYGTYMISQTGENGLVSWQTRRGTYYVKQLEAAVGYYRNRQIIPVVVADQSVYTLSYRSHRPVVVVESVSEGKITEGGLWQLLDGDEIIEQWNQSDAYVLNSEKLIPDKTYRIHEVEAPQHCQKQNTDLIFLIPEDEDGEIHLQISHKAKTQKTQSLQQTKQQNTQTQTMDSGKSWWLIIGGIAILLLVMKMFSKILKQFKKLH